MPRAANAGGLASSTFMKPFVVLALPGMYLFYKYNQYRRQQEEQNRRKVTERELAHLNHKIDKLLTKLEENEPELATSQEDECVICVNAKATMQTSPCGHRVVCRKCFVKTIQMAVSQRLLPLRCVICRAKILRLKQSSSGDGHHGHKGSSSKERAGERESEKWLLAGSSSGYSLSKSWLVPNSASQYSMGSHSSSVPNSASIYSMTSGSSSLSGVSSVSSATDGSQVSAKYPVNGSRMNGFPRQPTGSLRKSQAHSMKLRLQDYKEPPGRPGQRLAGPRELLQPEGRLPPIKEFQREYRAGKERAGSCSTRIRCAQKIVTQLETPLLHASSSSYFRSPLKPSNKEEKRKTEKRKEEKKTKEEEKVEDKSSKKAEKKEVKNEKKTEKKSEKKEEKKETKSDKKETKIEKKESKKEVKTEKKESKKEIKIEKKKEKKDSKSEKKEKE